MIVHNNETYDALFMEISRFVSQYHKALYVVWNVISPSKQYARDGEVPEPLIVCLW